MTNRKKATDWIINDFYMALEKDGTENIDLWKATLNGMTDKEFDEYFSELLSGNQTLTYTAANLHNKDVAVKDILKVGKMLGVNFFQRIQLTDPLTGLTYITPHEYFVTDMVVRRQSQHLMKGKSVPDDSIHTDVITGQVVGKSESASLSFPEVAASLAMGHKQSTVELYNFRGGNTTDWRNLRNSLLSDGTASIDYFKDSYSRPLAVDAVKNYLFAQHYDCNI